MSNLLSIFIGGLLAISGSSLVKWLEYLVERRSLRAALKAEITAMMSTVRRRDHGAMFADAVTAWRNGDDGAEIFMFGIDENFSPVYGANISRIGLLGADVAGDVVRFYDMILSVRADIRAQVGGETRNWPPARRAELMERDLEIWAEAMELGEAVAKRL